LAEEQTEKFCSHLRISRFSSNWVNAIDWCRSYHEPYISVADGRKDATTVGTVYSIYGAIAPLRLADFRGSKVVNLYLGATGKALEIGDGLTLIEEDETGSSYLFGNNWLCCWFPIQSRETMIQSARIIRERLITAALDAGAVRLHAAIAFLNRRAFLVLGSSGSGKTSLLLQCIRAGENLFCSNDRVLMIPGIEPIVHGVPLSIRIGIDNIHWFSSLAAFIADYESMSLLKRSHPSRLGGFMKFALTPQELALLLGLDIVPTCKIEGVIVPRLKRHPSIFVAGEIPHDTRRAILANQIVSDDPYFPSTLSPSKCGWSAEDAYKRADTLCHLPWFFAEGHFSDDALIPRLKTAIFGN
jgi:hypothetical protein